MGKINDFLYVYKPVMVPRPGGLGCSIYIVKGEKGLLQIDASSRGGGIDEKKYKELIEDGLDYQQIQALLITHCHPDHSRGVPFWSEKAKEFGINLPVYVHPQGVKYILDQSIYLHDLEASMGDFSKYVSYIPHGLGEKFTNIIWGSHYKYENAIGLTDGQEFDLGDVVVRTVFTPGHAQNHCAFELIQNNSSYKCLISGDLISFKDMEDGKGLRGLASFNTPLSSCIDEIASLKRIMLDPPDELFTAHYGSYSPKEKIIEFFNGAIAEAQDLWDRTLSILRTEGPQRFKKLTRKVINFKKYLSGIATRTSSMFVILQEMQKERLVKKSDLGPDYFEIVE